MDIPNRVEGRHIDNKSKFTVYFEGKQLGTVLSSNVKTAENELKTIAFNWMSTSEEHGRIFNSLGARNTPRMSHIKLYKQEGKEKVYYFELTVGSWGKQFIVHKK